MKTCDSFPLDALLMFEFPLDEADLVANKNHSESFMSVCLLTIQDSRLTHQQQLSWHHTKDLSKLKSENLSLEEEKWPWNPTP